MAFHATVFRHPAMSKTALASPRRPVPTRCDIRLFSANKSGAREALLSLAEAKPRARRESLVGILVGRKVEMIGSIPRPFPQQERGSVQDVEFPPTDSHIYYGSKTTQASLCCSSASATMSVQALRLQPLSLYGHRANGMRLRYSPFGSNKKKFIEIK
ncbi:hypothetical protein NL676_038258 [Syzygium grande]|nr:hypothetical protein NL676_038258 [Syzygium grande]